MTTTSMKREKFHELELVFIGESLAGTAENVDPLLNHGLELFEHEGHVLGRRGNTIYSLCGAGPRAFAIGTRCTNADPHYVPTEWPEYLESLSAWYSSFMPLAGNKVATMLGIRQFVPGRGEWVAESKGDALEMAVAFSRESAMIVKARAIAYNSGHSNILQAFRVKQAQDAVLHMPRLISFVFEAEMVMVDKASKTALDSFSIIDGDEVCFAYKGSKVIGRYIAVRGELRSYFKRGYREVQTSMPVTFTFPLDYPVFVG